MNNYWQLSDDQKRIVLQHNSMKRDYEAMRGTMMYGESVPFDDLLARMEVLQTRFRNR